MENLYITKGLYPYGHKVLPVEVKKRTLKMIIIEPQDEVWKTNYKIGELGQEIFSTYEEAKQKIITWNLSTIERNNVENNYLLENNKDLVNNGTYWVVIHKWGIYKYSFHTLRVEDGEEVVQFICKKAKIDQEILKSDIRWLISDLPNIIDKINL